MLWHFRHVIRSFHTVTSECLIDCFSVSDAELLWRHGSLSEPCSCKWDARRNAKVDKGSVPLCAYLLSKDWNVVTPASWLLAVALFSFLWIAVEHKKLEGEFCLWWTQLRTQHNWLMTEIVPEGVKTQYVHVNCCTRLSDLKVVNVLNNQVIVNYL